MNILETSSEPSTVPTQHAETGQTPLAVIDTEEARRILAGLANPQEAMTGTAVGTEIKEACYRLCSILASLYGENLDRLDMWGRIASALETSLAKVSGDDLDRLIDMCLQHVCADPAIAAASPALGALLQTIEVRPTEWRLSFLAYLRDHRFGVLVHGRDRWTRVKNKEVEL